MAMGLLLPASHPAEGATGLHHSIAPSRKHRRAVKDQVVMLRSPLLVRRLTQMSVDTGQVSTALKSVLEKASAAAQKSGRNTKVGRLSIGSVSDVVATVVTCLV